MKPDEVAHKLVAMAKNDANKRAQLAATGVLYDGYHPEMEQVHNENAKALEDVIATLGGWPGRDIVGDEASEAAWLIAQHAIGLPDFQRRMLKLLQSSGAQAWQAAYLEDRIRIFEGRPQIYGTQFDWDEAGVMSPLPIENPGGVNARRAAIGLQPIEKHAEEVRRRAKEENEKPVDMQKRKAEMKAWAKKAGWR